MKLSEKGHRCDRLQDTHWTRWHKKKMRDGFNKHSKGNVSSCAMAIDEPLICTNDPFETETKYPFFCIWCERLNFYCFLFPPLFIVTTIYLLLSRVIWHLVTRWMRHINGRFIMGIANKSRGTHDALATELSESYNFLRDQLNIISSLMTMPSPVLSKVWLLGHEWC